MVTCAIELCLYVSSERKMRRETAIHELLSVGSEPHLVALVKDEEGACTVDHVNACMYMYG